MNAKIENIKKATIKVYSDLGFGLNEIAYEKENFQWALKLAEALLDTKNKVSAAKVKCKKIYKKPKVKK